MKEEIARIMRLVQEGKITPEDAAELIDAFSSSEHQEQPQPPKAGPQAPPPPPEEPRETPPPPPPGPAQDPFKSFVDTMESLGREVSQSVNWHDVARQIRQGAQKGVEGLKVGIDEISKGKVHLGWFSAYENRDVTLPLADVTSKTLRIENPCGDVKVTGGFADGSVSARARVRGSDATDAHDKADQYTVIIEESDHEILIRQPDVSGLEVDLVVQLLTAQHIDIRTTRGDVKVIDAGGSSRVSNASGDITLRGLNGVIEVTTQNGDLNIEDCTSPSVTVENKTGDIHVERVTGNVSIRTASGNVKFGSSSGKSIAIESVNGDVGVELVEPVSGNVSIRTVNGDASLVVPFGSDCRVSLSTLRGNVTCEAALLDEAQMEQRITGRLGDGTGSVDVSAVNGDVKFDTN
ncbi:MAG TPA: DUF4097 family beta strand repeat-containing protein [Fimbriimonadaceae bacterium]|jgi:hypothetical protein